MSDNIDTGREYGGLEFNPPRTMLSGCVDRRRFGGIGARPPRERRRIWRPGTIFILALMALIAVVAPAGAQVFETRGRTSVNVSEYQGNASLALREFFGRADSMTSRIIGFRSGDKAFADCRFELKADLAGVLSFRRGAKPLIFVRLPADFDRWRRGPLVKRAVIKVMLANKLGFDPIFHQRDVPDWLADGLAAQLDHRLSPRIIAAPVVYPGLNAMSMAGKEFPFDALFKPPDPLMEPSRFRLYQEACSLLLDAWMGMGQRSRGIFRDMLPGVLGGMDARDALRSALALANSAVDISSEAAAFGFDSESFGFDRVEFWFQRSLRRRSMGTLAPGGADFAEREFRDAMLVWLPPGAFADAGGGGADAHPDGGAAAPANVDDAEHPGQWRQIPLAEAAAVWGRLTPDGRDTFKKNAIFRLVSLSGELPRRIQAPIGEISGLVTKLDGRSVSRLAERLRNPVAAFEEALRGLRQLESWLDASEAGLPPSLRIQYTFAEVFTAIERQRGLHPEIGAWLDQTEALDTLRGWPEAEVRQDKPAEP